ESSRRRVEACARRHPEGDHPDDRRGPSRDRPQGKAIRTPTAAREGSRRPRPRGHAKVILVDTSAWIEFFRGRDPVARAVGALLEGAAGAICGPVLTELRRGLRSRADRRRVLPLLAACHVLEQPDALWVEAGDLGYLLGRRGATVKSLDL